MDLIKKIYNIQILIYYIFFKYRSNVKNSFKLFTLFVYFINVIHIDQSIFNAIFSICKNILLFNNKFETLSLI